MSWEATAWAKKTRGHKSHGAARLLLVLADYAEPKTHLAWPSQSSLAEDCEMSERNVRYCLDTLANQGFVKVVRKGNQHQTTLYRLAVAERYEPETSAEANIAGADQLAGSQAYAPETSEAANIAGAEVNRQAEASEPEISSSEPEIAIADEPPSRAASIEPPMCVPTPMLETYDGEYLKAFEAMRSLAKWDRSKEANVAQWLARDNITGEQAYSASLAICSKYDPKKHKDLPMTLRNWANIQKQSDEAREEQRGRASPKPSRRTSTDGIDQLKEDPRFAHLFEESQE